MVNLESLPREQCQTVFRIAYEDAASDDRDSNDNIRTYIRCYRGYDRLATPITSGLSMMLCPGYGSSSGKYKRDVPGQGAPAIFCPAIHKLTVSLVSVYPGLMDDINFVVKKHLEISSSPGYVSFNIFSMISWTS